jgi:TrmH family RNA methyltransferase
MVVTTITSKENPLYKRLRLALRDNSAYKTDKFFWIEGENLCLSAIEKGWHFKELVLLEDVVPAKLEFWQTFSDHIYTLPRSLLTGLSQLPSAAWILGSLSLPLSFAIDSTQPVVVLDQIQDPGNAGSIIRSAAAFGFKQVITTPGSVSLWSDKVVRAGMGAHFSVQLTESVDISYLIGMSIPVMLTDSHDGEFLHELTSKRLLPGSCLWVFGHEGRGVNANWPSDTVRRIRIAQPGGQESLNVAAAAAICLHAHASQRI